MNAIKHVIEQAMNKWNREKKPFLVLYLFLVALNAPLIFLRLTNQYDGLWNQDDYMAGEWELSNGRWFWPYLDHARFGISLDPLPNLLATAGFVGMVLLLARAMRLSWNKRTYLASMLFLASTGITCQLSFSYMSITFAFSAVMAVLGVNLVTLAAERRDQKYGIRSILIAGVVIAVMMGCYQASLGLSCLTALFYVMKKLTGADESIDSNDTTSDDLIQSRKEALHFAGKMFISLLVGGVFYLIGLNLHEQIFHVEPADYQGFSDLTPAYLIVHLPMGVAHAYETFHATFWNGTFLIFRGQRTFGIRLLYLIPIAVLLILFLRTVKKNLVNGILFLVCTILIPVFANSFYLLAPESECHIQMIVPMTLVIPLIYMLGGSCWPSDVSSGRTEKRFKEKLCSCAVTLGCTALLLASAAMSLTDAYAMYAGRQATGTLAREILHVMNAQGYDYANGSVMILGNAKESQTFSITELYEKANEYAKYGSWTDEVGLNNQIWEKVYSDYLRLKVSFVTRDTLETINNMPELSQMPCYPAVGSAQNIYGVEVIKLAGINHR